MTEPYRLAPDLIEELQDLAMQGDVIALTRRIEATLARDSSAVALCEEMRELVAHYDMRGIRKILAANRGA